MDTHLPGRQADDRQSHALQRHSTQSNGDLLSGGQQHIHLPLGGLGIDFSGLFDQIIGSVTLGRQNHQKLVPCPIGIGNDPRHVHDPLCVTDGAAAKFLYNQTHLGTPLFRK